MFRKVLVANRGEIAVRVMRACRELGIETVAIYSEADRDALHVSYADESFCIGPAPSSKSYMNIPAIISSALLSGADAIHPGYGLLSERADFAEICQAHNLKFIGPPAEAIQRMGDKAVAKQTMRNLGVPVVPGTDGAITNPAEAAAIAEEIGYPVIVKASAGGGGRGMRVARSREEFMNALQAAQSEAQAAFGNAEVYLEHYVEEPRHIEVQIMADEHGNIVHLGERDCSIQRRHQKLIEEAMSPAVTPELRAKLGETAIRGARGVGYTNAGTMEFLLDKHGNFYFMEMNTRIQVEHPVTELVTGLDLVKEQLLVAAGEPLGIKQEDIIFRGHSIECRINAEDPDQHFRPCPGRISAYLPPGGPGVRVDSAAYAGYTIPPHYDSMFAKLIVWAPTRDEAISRMNRALDEFVIEGIKTTIPFHRKVLANAAFRAGDVHTNFIQHRMSDGE